MALIGGKLADFVLGHFRPDGASCSGSAYCGHSKLEILLGVDVWQKIKNKVVIDFGCGDGSSTIEMARRGAAKVIGLDIQEDLLVKAREAAEGIDNVEFRRSSDELADVIVSVDSFEHFDDPASILGRMCELLLPEGRVLVSFGPTWFHPYGGHLFSVFPWAHLIFSERALIRWRANYRNDGATRFGEVQGGLNQMTIRRFESLVRQSPLQLAAFDAVPIRVVRRLHNRVTREFFTAIVQTELIKRKEPTGRA
jgi:SAM-dependent methyltransferase